MAGIATLLQTRQAYLTALSAVTGLNVSSHGGVFDIKELQRYSRKAPAAVLTLLGFDSVRLQDSVEIAARWGVVLFCLDAPQMEKGAAVISLVEQCLLVIGSTWACGRSGGSRPTGLSARTIFGSALDGTGCAMWQMEWSQRLLIDSDVDDSDAVPFKSLDVTWDLSPRDNDAPLGDVPDAHDSIALEGDST